MVNQKVAFLAVLLCFSFLYLESHCFWTVVISRVPAGFHLISPYFINVHFKKEGVAAWLGFWGEWEKERKEIQFCAILIKIKW